MKKTILTLLCLYTSAALAAPSPVGRYDGESKDPNSGSTSLHIRPNGKFIIGAYATLIVGKWEQQGRYLILRPHNLPQFSVYGRTDPSLKKEARLRFTGDLRGLLIGSNLGAMYPYGDDRCPDNTILHKKTDTLLLAATDDELESSAKPKAAYRFDTGQANDLVVHYQHAIIRNGG
ncbi:hypothetical protein [Neisseria sp.]|uniref:hypothetical protein n=1 Tax=Neisseria sp. TaxID=192066 RepID=UPI00359F3AD4